ncbi:MAG: hypothetical protein EZS28_008418 [Streblomastix strix]|uniref:Uncharacterized protein n=1 Tax=Streblomastix strix TaxID=222440 RepID=A0A5J4WN18_9EUKA|nr:MAG: hypothetical protein EZS28_008418 [Streblomastix strix]
MSIHLHAQMEMSTKDERVYDQQCLGYQQIKIKINAVFIKKIKKEKEKSDYSEIVINLIVELSGEEGNQEGQLFLADKDGIIEIPDGLIGDEDPLLDEDEALAR